MGLFKAFGRAIGKGIESVGNFVGSEKVSNFGRNVQDACSETSRKVSETRGYDKQKASINQTVNMSEILLGFSLGLQAQADTIERNCVAESQRYFDDLIKALDTSKSAIKINRLKASLKSVKGSINGSIKNHLAKRVSLDDSECLEILQMSVGKLKENNMKAFGKKVINEALNKLSKQISDIVKDQNTEIQEFLEDILEKQEKELNSMKSQFNAIVTQAENDVLDKEKARLTPLVLMDVTEIVITNFANEF